MLSKESDDKMKFLTENPFFFHKDSPFPLLNIYSNRQTTSVLSLVFELSIRTKRAHFVSSRVFASSRYFWWRENTCVIVVVVFVVLLSLWI